MEKALHKWLKLQGKRMLEDLGCQSVRAEVKSTEEFGICDVQGKFETGETAEVEIWVTHLPDRILFIVKAKHIPEFLRKELEDEEFLNKCLEEDFTIKP